MTFGRWLLIHSFSIFLVGVLIFGYLYRDELQLEQAYQQLLNLDEHKNVIGQLAEKNDPENKNNEQADVQVSTPAKSNPVKTTDRVKQDQTLLQVEAKPTVVDTEIEQDDLLHNARKSYWDKNYQKSITLYQQLIDREPGNVDYSGELGNVYYAMNDYQHAAQMYYRSASILIDKGQRDAARQLLSPVTAMDRALGDRLEQRLSQ